MKTKTIMTIYAMTALQLVAYGQLRPRIAILPTINASGERDDNLKTQEKAIADKFLTEEFSTRRFNVIPAGSVKAAIARLNIDMSDEEQWKREALFKLGHKLGADFVLFDVITSNGQHKSPNVFTVTAEGWVEQKLWLVNVPKRSAALSARTFRGSSKHSEFVVGTVTGTKLQKLAVANGLTDVLKSFFASYPKQP